MDGAVVVRTTVKVAFIQPAEIVPRLRARRYLIDLDFPGRHVLDCLIRLPGTTLPTRERKTEAGVMMYCRCGRRQVITVRLDASCLCTFISGACSVPYGCCTRTARSMQELNSLALTQFLAIYGPEPGEARTIRKLPSRLLLLMRAYYRINRYSFQIPIYQKSVFGDSVYQRHKSWFYA